MTLLEIELEVTKTRCLKLGMHSGVPDEIVVAGLPDNNDQNLLLNYR